VEQTFGTRKPAFLAGSRIVPKLTLCETASFLVVARLTLDLFCKLAMMDGGADGSQPNKQSDQSASNHESVKHGGRTMPKRNGAGKG